MTELATEVLAAAARKGLGVATHYAADDDPRISEFGARLNRLDAQHAELRVSYEDLHSEMIAASDPTGPRS